MTRKEWEEELKVVALRRKKLSWEMAYLLVHAQAEGYDPDFAESSRITGYSRSHLWNMYRVGRGFPPGRAHPDLSFSAHRELLRVEDENERMILLSEALEKGWTTEEIIAHIPPQNKKKSQTDKAVDSRKRYVGMTVRCPECGHKFLARNHKDIP